MASAAGKSQRNTQRLFDLLTALLRHGRNGIAFADLREEVPGYWGEEKNPTSVKMMFERDKSDLRDLGITLDVVEDETGNATQYRLNPADFYLPRLQRSDSGSAASGGSAQTAMSFTSNELMAMSRGVHLLAQLGYSGLAEHASAGLRRLSHDLPLEDYTDRPEVVKGETGIDQDVFERLGDAVQRRKRVSFVYHGLEQSEARERRVLPLGLACIEGRWSLFAHDEEADSLRQFRLRRLRDLDVNEKNKGTPDFDVPRDFNLWELTRHRFEWELGGDEPEDIVVEFLADNGLTVLALQQGDADPESPMRRTFSVRRREPFLRWVMSFTGDARVIAPEDAARDFRTLARDVVEAHRAEATR